MSRYTDYMDALDGGLELGWRYELISDDGRYLALLGTWDPTETQAAGATLEAITWQPGVLSPRTSTMQIVDPTDELICDGPEHPLHPDARSAVRVYGICNPRSSNPVEIIVATLAIERTRVRATHDVATSTSYLVSRTRPLDSELDQPIHYDDGTVITSLVRKLMAQVMGRTPFTVTDAPWTAAAGTFQTGRNRLDAINKMLASVGHELADDPEGRISTRPVLPSGDGEGERWTYGTDGIPIEDGDNDHTDQVPEGIHLIGGSLQNNDRPPEVTVYDTDPTSAGYYDGEGGARIQPVTNPFIQSEAQAVDAGYAYLRLTGRGPRQVEILTLPNPMLREGDLVDLDYPPIKAAGTFRVVGFTYPPELNGHQRIKLREVFEPRVNYQGSGSPDGAATFVSDDFNRPYENLENLPPPGEPGSPNWTEFGWSWAVVGQRAVQRYHGGWSFARYNTPLTSSAMAVQVRVYPLSGNEVGPMVRSSGQYDGYSALAEPGGRIRLVRWQGGHISAVLKEWRTGSNPTGKIVRLEATGSTLTVKVDGSALGSVTDDVLHGNYTGMVGYGRGGPANPACDDFQGEVI